jgi:CheY-like chemotaxis protein
MPGEDGYEFIRALRAFTRGDGGATPAIALTAYARMEDRLRALTAGFNNHVPKPVDARELTAVIANLRAVANP